MTSTAFEWPWHYSFPPFFTLQPNEETRRKQLDAWCQLVLAHQKFLKKTSLDLKESADNDLFYNRQLKRRLNAEGILVVMEELRRRGNLEWISGGSRNCGPSSLIGVARIIWRSTEEWANLVYQWARDTGHINSVCTLFELTDGEDTEDQAFHGLDKPVLMAALRYLEQHSQAEIIMFDGNEGVKFF